MKKKERKNEGKAGMDKNKIEGNVGAPDLESKAEESKRKKQSKNKLKGETAK